MLLNQNEPSRALPETYYAPSERDSLDVLRSQRDRVAGHPLLLALMNCAPDALLVLNPHRQIVVANQAALALLEKDADTVLGMRPGEALECVHVGEGPSGCGTSLFCTVCGAVRAILQSQQSMATDVEECRVTHNRGEGRESLNLRVWATTFPINHERFTVFALRDVSDEKRRRALERVFFHDILNSISGLRIILELIDRSVDEDQASNVRIATELVDRVTEEITAQRDLMDAEQGDLVVTWKECDVVGLINSLIEQFRATELTGGRSIAALQASGTAEIPTDPVILRRVLGNLIRNALEASRPGQTVRVIYANDREPTIRIHNETVMPEATQLQVFQRSFSTKGPGRGLGTYSVKMLVERYLNGRVGFVSAPGMGTTFTVALGKPVYPKPFRAEHVVDARP